MQQEVETCCSVRRPSKAIRIVSLLVLFVENFDKVNLVSLLDISFHSFLTQTAAIFRVAQEYSTEILSFCNFH